MQHLITKFSILWTRHIIHGLLWHGTGVVMNEPNAEIRPGVKYAYGYWFHLINSHGVKSSVYMTEFKVFSMSHRLQQQTETQ